MVKRDFLLKAKKKLYNAPPEDILGWAAETYGNNLGIMTALGYSGIVMMDKYKKFNNYFEPYFIDTGFNFPETIELITRLERFWNIKFKRIKPLTTLEELKEKVGEQPWKINPDLCCHYMKVEPLLRVIHEKDAWLSGLRRDQSPTRSKIDNIEIDGRGTIKIHPLAKWSSEQCWNYIKKHNIPYNKLHDRNYLSIGCTHCTQPVKKGEHERAGRWNSMPKFECGIHLNK